MYETNVQYAELMDPMPLDENRASLDRLTELAVLLADGAPVTDSAARDLAQLAFWDRWAHQLLIRWRTGGMPPPALPEWYDQAINAAMADTWAALPVAVAANIAVRAATAVDAEITHVEGPVQAALTAAGQLQLVHRYLDRVTVLDRFDQERAAA